MSGTHAPLAPSAAHRWMRCFASTRMELGLPDQSSEFAEEGTRAHEYAAWILAGKNRVEPDGVEMVEHVSAYAARVRALTGGGRYPVLIEQRVDMRPLVPECYGTSDAILIADDELVVADLKYGMGERVDADENEQGQLYAVGAFLANRDHHDFVQPFKQARIIIDQPRLNHLSEWTIKIEDLLLFAARANSAAEKNIFFRDTIQNTADIPREWFNPGPKQCRWCKAFATCPAAREKIDAAMREEYQAIPDDVSAPSETAHAALRTKLAAAMQQVAYVEHWAKAVRAATFTELQHGHAIAGWKLVQGRQGNRAWSDEAAADKLLTLARLKQDERYTFKIISPTAAEKILKDKPKYWAKAQALITRAEGSLSVAPESDERPAYSLAHEYEALPEIATPQPDYTEYA